MVGIMSSMAKFTGSRSSFSCVGNSCYINGTIRLTKKGEVMEICANSSCNNVAEIEKVLDAPFSMTSTGSQSQRVVRVCSNCDEQDKRMERLER